MLNLDAEVHDDIESGSAGNRSCFLIHDAQLHPDGSRSRGDRVVNHRRYIAGATKNIDDIDTLRQVSHRVINGQAKYLRLVGIDQIDRVPSVDEIASNV